MKPGWKLTELFAPYELSVAAVMVGLLLLAAAFTAFYFGFAPGSVLALIGCAALINLLADVAIHCPGCGKSPLRLDLTNRQDGIRRLLSLRRFWPERECSRCRAPLDIL